MRCWSRRTREESRGSSGFTYALLVTVVSDSRAPNFVSNTVGHAIRGKSWIDRDLQPGYGANDAFAFASSG